MNAKALSGNLCARAKSTSISRGRAFGEETKTKVEHLVERENGERLLYLGEENRKRDRCSKYRAK